MVHMNQGIYCSQIWFEYEKQNCKGKQHHYLLLAESKYVKFVWINLILDHYSNKTVDLLLKYSHKIYCENSLATNYLRRLSLSKAIDGICTKIQHFSFTQVTF